MASRCEHCKHWVDTVYAGQSASGWGVWYGDCRHPQSSPIRDDRHHSLYLACGRFEPGAHPNSLSATMAARASTDRPVVNPEKDQP